MKHFLYFSTIILFSIFSISACNSGDDESNIDVDNFDRTAMLENWADNIIVPAYDMYVEKLINLESALTTFTTSTDSINLSSLRSTCSDAYTAWQNVSMFEIGKAEEVSLRNFTNIYPTATDEIEENISSGSYNLILPSTNDEQGFPAIDYLINGLANTDEAIVAKYTDLSEGEAYKRYLSNIVNRMLDLATEVRDDWTVSFRDEFVNNKGSSATSSVNSLVNDYIFYYEKFLRAGKIGIPAGVFSGSPLNHKVEAFFANEMSKPLFLSALNSSQDFFNGKHFGQNTSGESLSTYLDYLNTITEGDDLNALINSQFELIRQTAEALDPNFKDQIEADNTLMLATYDELQKNVILLKVDMLQALNIKVDYVDADGD